MSAPLVPSPLDYIGRNRFAFYPAIRNADPNSWVLGAGSWSEVQVINTQTGCDIWIPRQFIGAVSENQQCLVVGLTQQVELRNGDIVPRGQRRLIQMPAPHDRPVQGVSKGPADVIGIRIEKKSTSPFQQAPFRVGIVILFVVGLLVLVESASR